MNFSPYNSISNVMCENQCLKSAIIKFATKYKDNQYKMSLGFKPFKSHTTSN